MNQDNIEKSVSFAAILGIYRWGKFHLQNLNILCVDAVSFSLMSDPRTANRSK